MSLHPVAFRPGAKILCSTSSTVSLTGSLGHLAHLGQGEGTVHLQARKILHVFRVHIPWCWMHKPLMLMSTSCQQNAAAFVWGR